MSGSTSAGVRRALISDVPAIIALLADDDLGRGREDPSPAALASYESAFHTLAGDANQLPLVLVMEGVVRGYLQITFIPGLSRGGMWRGLIESVRIDTCVRGQGLGALLMNAAIAACRDRGCGLVQLTTDKRRIDAQRFYERLGFEASHVGMKLAL
jgi:GNAT superfamily N-acetyltransferase